MLRARSILLPVYMSNIKTHHSRLPGISFWSSHMLGIRTVCLPPFPPNTSSSTWTLLPSFPSPVSTFGYVKACLFRGCWSTAILTTGECCSSQPGTCLRAHEQTAKTNSDCRLEGWFWPKTLDLSFSIRETAFFKVFLQSQALKKLFLVCF